MVKTLLIPAIALLTIFTAYSGKASAQDSPFKIVLKDGQTTNDGSGTHYYYDENGNRYYKDQYGNRHYDNNGTSYNNNGYNEGPYYYDQNGNRYYYDQYGNKHYDNGDTSNYNRNGDTNYNGNCGNTGRHDNGKHKGWYKDKHKKYKERGERENEDDDD